MNKFIKISLIVGVLISIVIVDTMADPSAIFSIDPMGEQQIAADINSGYHPLTKNDATPTINSKGGNFSALLSMSMIGLTLVGLANFRLGRQKRKLDSQIAHNLNADN
jgi:hypothetical protein